MSVPGAGHAGKIERSAPREIASISLVRPASLARPTRRTRTEIVRSLAPAAQTAAVAVGGILAGAAIVGLAGRRRTRAAKTLGRRPSRGRNARRPGSRRGGSGRAGLEILATRSLLVDIHVLGIPGAEH